MLQARNDLEPARRERLWGVERLEKVLVTRSGSSTMYAKHAEELGELKLKVELEEMAADEAGHAREPRRLLKGL
jgi:hypothetical protein